MDPLRSCESSTSGSSLNVPIFQAFVDKGQFGVTAIDFQIQLDSLGELIFLLGPRANSKVSELLARYRGDVFAGHAALLKRLWGLRRTDIANEAPPMSLGLRKRTRRAMSLDPFANDSQSMPSWSL